MPKRKRLKTNIVKKDPEDGREDMSEDVLRSSSKGADYSYSYLEQLLHEKDERIRLLEHMLQKSYSRNEKLQLVLTNLCKAL